jgi:hypothetical protein
MKIILKELKMNRKEFIEACNKVNPYISKPTILNVINGNSKGLPKLETIDTIIKVCKKSNNENLKNISYDYLMNEYIHNISKDNMDIGKKLHLSDESINRLKSSYYLADSDIISHFIDRISDEYWEYQSYMKNICSLQRSINDLNKLSEKFPIENSKSIVDLYCEYKKQELSNTKKDKSKKEYKKYLIQILSVKDIFETNYTIEELEDSVIEMYRSFSGYLKDIFEDFLRTGEVNDDDKKRYSKEDLDGFKIYLKNNYKYINNSLNRSYLNCVMYACESYISAYLLEYLRANFKTQHKYIKDRAKLYKKILLYKDNIISLPLDIYNEVNEFMKGYYNSLDIFNKYLRLLISDSLSIYYNKMVD